MTFNPCPFHWHENRVPSIFADDRKPQNQYTAGRKVNLARMPESTFSGHIATPDDSRKTNSLKRMK